MIANPSGQVAAPRNRKVQLAAALVLVGLVVVLPGVRSQRFRVLPDDTVLDTATELVWAATDNAADIDWAGAGLYATSFRGGGHQDWRLPTSAELLSLYTAGEALGGGYEPACDSQDGGSSTPFGTVSLRSPKGMRLTCWFFWASETQHGDAAIVGFNVGDRGFVEPHDAAGMRALPVRSHR